MPGFITYMIKEAREITHLLAFLLFFFLEAEQPFVWSLSFKLLLYKCIICAYLHTEETKYASSAVLLKLSRIQNLMWFSVGLSAPSAMGLHRPSKMKRKYWILGYNIGKSNLKNHSYGKRLYKIRKLKGSVGPRQHLCYEPFIYHMKHVGNLSFTLMNDYFLLFFLAWTRVEGKTRRHRFWTGFDCVLWRTRELLPEQD